MKLGYIRLYQGKHYQFSENIWYMYIYVVRDLYIFMNDYL